MSLEGTSIRGAGVGSKRRGGAELPDATGLGEDLAGQQVTDPAELGQGAAVGLDGCGDLGGGDAPSSWQISVINSLG